MTLAKKLNDNIEMNDNILIVRNLKILPDLQVFHKKNKAYVKAVDDISFSIKREQQWVL